MLLLNRDFSGVAFSIRKIVKKKIKKKIIFRLINPESPYQFCLQPFNILTFFKNKYGTVYQLLSKLFL
jgi:hypothetical protein